MTQQDRDFMRAHFWGPLWCILIFATSSVVTLFYWDQGERRKAREAERQEELDWRPAP